MLIDDNGRFNRAAIMSKARWRVAKSRRAMGLSMAA